MDGREAAYACGMSEKGFSRPQIQDAITAWRDGATYNALHPLRDCEPPSWLWDPDAVKDLARVIAHSLNGEQPPAVPLPWS